MIVAVTVVLLFAPISVTTANERKCSPAHLAPSRLNHYTTLDDERMGKKAFDDSQMNTPFSIVDDPVIGIYFSHLTKKLKRHCIACLKIPAHIYVTRREFPGGSDAESFGGGYILFTLKAIASMESEDRLVGTLGHELGHTELRHGSTEIALYAAHKSAGLFSTIRDEDEADLFAVHIAVLNGYDPHSYMTFIVREATFPVSRFTLFVNKHRPGNERAARMEKEYHKMRCAFPNVKKHVLDGKFEAMRDHAIEILTSHPEQK